MKPYGFENAENCTVRLDANESFVPLPQHIRDEIADIAGRLAYNRYPDSLSTAAITAYSKYIGIPKELITAGNGSDELINIIISSLMDSGDKLLVADPDFSMYRFYASVAQVEVVSAPKNADMTIDLGKLRETVQREKPKAVIFSNPCSPTGQGISAEDMLSLTDHPCLWIVDEAYMDFWDQSIVSEAVKRDNIIVLRTCSKAFGLAGIRLGFAIANPILTEAMRKAKSPANVNSFTDAVAAAVLSDSDYISNAISQIKESARALYNELCSLLDGKGLYTVYTTKANFVYLTVCNDAKKYDLAAYLRKNGILIRRLGDDLRITAGTVDENRSLINCIKQWLTEVVK